jgi:beta-barrel assembly-enhancing protease
MTRTTLTALAAPALALSLISVKQEVEIGRQAQQQIKRDVPEVRDAAVTEYVASIGRRLASRAGGPGYPYSFSVANYREINAFALPGGPVWIHRGAIQAAATEAQLAGVLAHEIAHIAQRHAADQMTKSLVANGLLGLLGAVLGNDGGARAARVGAQILAGSYMLKFSRDDEREADSAGAAMMRRAGWDPRGLVEFLDTLRREQGRDPGRVQVFLSSHPAPGERVTRLQGELRGKTGGRRDSAEFQRVRARVNAMPPAPAMKR